MTDNYSLCGWWEKENEGDAHAHVWNIAASLETHQKMVWERCNRNAKAYGIDLRSSERYEQTNRYEYECANVIDQKLALGARNNVVPYALTDGGTAQDQRKAREFNYLIDGLFYMTDVFDMMNEIRFDAMMYRVGIMRVVTAGGSLSLERIPRYDFEVDDREPGKPLEFGIVYHIERQSLYEYCEKLGLSKKKYMNILDDASHDARSWELAEDSSRLRDMITVRERWHTTEKKHIVCVSSGTLLLEDVEEHPFCFFNEFPKASGRMFGDTCSMDRMQRIQLKIINLEAAVDKCVRQSAPKTITYKNSDVRPYQINNEIGDALEVNDPTVKPERWNPIPFPQELIQALDRNIERLYKSANSTEAATFGDKPKGVTAASAIRYLNDMQSGLDSLFLRQEEKFMVDLGHKLIAGGRDICEEYGSFIVPSIKGREIKFVDFEKADIGSAGYRLKVFPTSWLPRTPAAKLDMLAQLKAENMATPEQVKRLSGMADIDAEFKVDTSPTELADKLIENVLATGKVPSIEEFFPVTQIVNRGASAYCNALLEGKETNIDALVEFISAAMQKERELKAANTVAPAPAQMPDPMAGGAPPGMSPMPDEAMMGMPPSGGM